MAQIFLGKKLGNNGLIRRDPPPPGWLKMNVDGSLAGNPGMAVIGGLIRDHSGMWVMGFCQKVGWASAIKAEIWALWQGINIAWSQGS
ncbi:hypothetical protein HYC85_027707 [Camellia sinensis]|uniref:RNase H type-1 domain-containing protein n=1 Tax=Camellia sinensis TaxID=4442 RepID=A0A7J7FX25_CAMSI|nr:hypothetical protein HYC85_027707 [Camellia sinensis]